MTDGPEPDAQRLEAARDTVQTFLRRKRRWTVALFWVAGFFEAIFGIGMLIFMDWKDRTHWFLLFGFLTVYTPLITMTWRNFIKIDALFYRLVEELKYER